MLVSPGMLEQLSVGELKAGIQLGLKAGKGACYPAGSWKLLIEKLANIIREKGEIRTASKVDEIKIKNKKVDVVRYKGDKTIRANIVIINLPCTEIFSILDEKEFSKEFVTSCKNMVPTVGISMDFGLTKKISDFDGSVLTADPFTMSIFTSNIDSSVAPEGKQLYTIFQPTMKETINSEEKSEEVIEEMERMLEEIFPGFKEAIEWKRVIKYKLVDGAIPIISQHRNRRPNVKNMEIKNLYFTGDSYNGPGTGGEIAHASAELCIKTIIDDLNLEQ